MKVDIPRVIFRNGIITSLFKLYLRTLKFKNMLQKILSALFFFTVSIAFAQTPSYYNSSEIFLQLKKLKVLGSVLYIAAHPDDENNSLLPWFAKEKLYRTGYLSLTRGDGGQNLIGSEQGVDLGMIRTEELLAARKIDGAEQYFSTAYEFGFSKNAQEALDIWGHDKILSDVVWVIRQYQPDIIVTRFPGDKRAGHGHHAASSILANEAFIAAADKNKFPEQFKYGVIPWQAKTIFWNTYNFGNINTISDGQLKFEVGGFNPLLGKSYGELGGEARSMHKSQGEGRPRRKGSITEYFTVTGGDKVKTDLMDGIMTSWSRLPGGSNIDLKINDILSAYKIDEPELSVPALVSLFKSIKELPASNWKEIKLKELQKIIVECSGLFIEATTNLENVVQGEYLPITIFLNKRKNTAAIFKQIQFEGFDSTFNYTLVTDQNFALNKMIQVSPEKSISQPYWLVYPQKEGSFDVRDQLMIGKAENDAAYTVKFVLNIEGVDFIISCPIEYKTVDPVKGELYEPLVILPKGEINFIHNNFLSTISSPVKVASHFFSNEKAATSIHIISTTVPPGWKKANKSETEISKNNFLHIDDYTSLLTKENNKSLLQAEVRSGGKTYDQFRKVISYDHIPVITYFAKAQANLVTVDLKKSGNNIGYIIGAGDKVPEELQQMGYQLTYLDETALTDENLKKFDAIIVGIRAYNIYEYLSDKNDILNRYIKNGGNLIVQYIKSNNVGERKINIGPYPFTINGGIRVTEENAKVHFLLPTHPVLNFPNKITEKDFEGWIQERSTYQSDKSDDHYEKPLGMNDSGEAESNGSLLIAKYGKGNFVYLSLVLFRQLPAGIPGAYRLMANCISLPKN